jgi:hypothetical protein
MDGWGTKRWKSSEIDCLSGIANDPFSKSLAAQHDANQQLHVRQLQTPTSFRRNENMEHN